jgi:A/G-specific adenine glycosylase
MLDLMESWYSTNRRDLPWRRSNPWGVLVSEFMLQQTPVLRVLPKWDEWMERWPKPSELAGAAQSEVVKAWGRLGYPRRALRLHATAKIIASDFSDEVPSDIELLKTLPGIGDYTAKAIASFAFGQSHNVLDINIRRVFARLIDGNENPTQGVTKRELNERPVFGPTWSAAIMELGALICTAKNPKCEKCPLARSCKWLTIGSPKSDQARRTQSWHGTNRQCRGMILQHLRTNTKQVRKESFDWKDRDQLEKCLQELIDEGFIHAKSGRYTLS